jgi:hypothetical protein
MSELIFDNISGVLYIVSNKIYLCKVDIKFIIADLNRLNIYNM